ncbi:hypothetical protein T4C_4987 [Trichinella pseudospiralis]|uniref:Uncharacterized protein n=1 Tax=Trichinella pseudospiralis TaxID=6337 RepID=A0A0V1GCH1_TRIPS|nr:hypothetical protein T4C_4987 [Trichinella pseudospiralis]
MGQSTEENMIWYWVGKTSLRVSRKNGNMQLREEGGWGNSPECTRDMGEPTSSRKTGHQVRDEVAIPQSKL